jgi:hypothetical protein
MIAFLVHASIYIIVSVSNIHLLAIAGVSMLASFGLAVLVGMLAWTLANFSSVMLARMVLVRVGLCLNKNVEVLASLSNSMHKDLLSEWPLIDVSLIIKLVVFGVRVLGDFFIEQSGSRSSACSCAGGISAFNLPFLFVTG